MRPNNKIISTGDSGIDVFLRPNAIHLQVYEYYGKHVGFLFDLTKENHRQAVKDMVQVLQHQLDACGGEE